MDGKKLFAAFFWTIRKSLIPVVPFVVVIVSRYVYSGEIKLGIPELSLAGALLIILVLEELNKIGDNQTEAKWTNFLSFFLIVTIIIFAGQLFLQTQRETLNFQIIELIEKNGVDNLSSVDIQVMQNQINQVLLNSTRLEYIVWVVLALDVLTVTILKFVYEIE